MMFEKAKPVAARAEAPSAGLTAEERARLQTLAGAGTGERFAGRSPRKGGEALRAVEWSELTARLNAARDLRLLMRIESQAPIEAAAASFGDAAASYFALLDGSEPDVNSDALGQLKGPDAMVDGSDENCPDIASEPRSDAPFGAARDM